MATWTRASVQRWLDAYVAAWKSYDREQIAALYSEDASCRYHPYDEAIIGRDAIVESWFGAGEGAPSRDPEGTYDGAYITAAIEGDLAVVTGTSTYSRDPGGRRVRSTTAGSSASTTRAAAASSPSGTCSARP